MKIGAGYGSPNYLARIDAKTGEISKLDTPGGDWSAVGGGSAWLLCDAAACDGGSVLRLDPSTGEQIGSTRLPDRGGQIAGVEDGVWVSTDAGVVFIDGSGEIGHQIGIRDADLIGSDGEHLWVSTSGRVLQLDPQSGDGLSNVHFSDPCTMEVADGMVWVASCDGGLTSIGDATDELMGIDAATGDVMFRRSIEGYGQMRYANGVLWLAQRDPSDQEGFRILRFDPRTGQDLGSPILIKGGADRFSTLTSTPPSAFFAVGEGSLWLTDFGGGEVIRVGIPSDLPQAPAVGDVATVPDLVGLQISEAIQVAEDAGVTVGTIQVLDDSKLGEPGADDVVAQDPAPGTQIDAGAEISVSVTAMAHSGPALVGPDDPAWPDVERRLGIYEAMIRYLAAGEQDPIYVSTELCSMLGEPVGRPCSDRLSRLEQLQLASRLADLGGVVFNNEGGSEELPRILLGPIVETASGGLRVEGGSVCGGLCGSGAMYVVNETDSGYEILGTDDSYGSWIA